MPERHKAIAVNDVEALMRLAGETGELPADVEVRRRHVIGELLKLIGGCAAVCMEFDDGPGDALARAGTVVEVGMTPADAVPVHEYLDTGFPPDPAEALFESADPFVTEFTRRVLDEKTWFNSEHFQQVRRPLRFQESLCSRVTLPEGPPIGVTLQRQAGDPPFTEHERELLHLFHSMLGRLYRLSGPDPDPRMEALPPRLRGVLGELIRGAGENQIAASPGLSRHTVHEYAKDLYRRFDVGGPGELMEECLQSA